MKANINIEIQIDNGDEGYISVGDFRDLLDGLNVTDDWSFAIEVDSCTYIRLHKNDDV